MGSSRYPLALVGWTAALVALAGLLAAALTWIGIGAAALLAASGLVICLAGLWRQMSRTSRILTHYVEALQADDFAVRVGETASLGHGGLSAALNGAAKRLQAERDRIRSEVRFLDSLVDELPIALLLVPARDEVRLLNKAARRLFGPDDRRHPTEFARFNTDLAQRLAAPGVSGVEVITLAGGTTPRRAALRVARIDRAGAASHVLSVEPIQEALDEAEMAAQRDLIRVLSHEVLNSLTPVISLGESVECLLAEEPLDLAAIRDAQSMMVRRMAGLRRFVDSYRNVSNLPAPHRRLIDAAAFADDVLRVGLSPQTVARTERRVDDGAAVFADPDLLSQAVINLLRNAAQAAGPDGHVMLAIHARGSQTEIAVEDDGPGVPAAIRSDIFLPFFTTRAEGSGVGLNLVRQVAVAHAGSITVEDSPMGGARFRLLV